MYGIFSYIWLFLMVKYGKCIGKKYFSPMDPMGVGKYTIPIPATMW